MHKKKTLRHLWWVFLGILLRQNWITALILIKTYNWVCCILKYTYVWAAIQWKVNWNLKFPLNISSKGTLLQYLLVAQVSTVSAKKQASQFSSHPFVFPNNTFMYQCVEVHSRCLFNCIFICVPSLIKYSHKYRTLSIWIRRVRMMLLNFRWN